MKIIFLTGIAAALFMPASFNIGAQNPTYKCRIESANQVSCNVYEFDVVLQRTGTNIFKLAMFQLGIQINPAIIPAGATIEVAPVPGSSQLIASQQISPDRISFDATKKCIIVLPVFGPGPDNATIISNYPTGTKLFRLRIACSQSYNTGIITNHEWSFSMANGYLTKVFAYVGTNITDITVQTSHSINTPGGNITLTHSGFAAPLPQTILADKYEYCINSGAYPVIYLSNTQAGYTYYLYKNDTLVAGINGVCFGNDSAASFGYHATGGVYTAKSISCSSTVDMLESVLITPITPIEPNVYIDWSPFGYNCVIAGDSVTFTANPLLGGDSPAYQWYVDNVPVGTASSYTFLPGNSFSVYCEMYSSESCVNAAIVTSNTIYVNVVPPPPQEFNVSGGGSICQGDTAGVTLAGSEPGITYYLSKCSYCYCSLGSSDPWGDPCRAKEGTGFPLVWDVTEAGTYFVTVNNYCSELPQNNAMPGNAIVVVKPVYAFTENHTMCGGETYNWRGTQYSTTGTYRVNYSSVNDCDSSYTLHLTVNPSYAFTEYQTICLGEPYNWHGQLLTTAGTYTASYQTIHGCDSVYTLHLNFNPSGRILELKVFLESLYADSGMMNQAQGMSGPQFETGYADEVTVELHYAEAPYSIAYEESNLSLMTNGMLTISSLPCSIDNFFYLVIKHRNSIETWSSSPLNFRGDGPFTYDFSLAASQAYGNNMKQMGTVFMIWGADATQDALVDGSDMAMVDNASIPPPLLGYYPEDVNGDGVVDGSDMAMIDNNSKPPLVQMIRP